MTLAGALARRSLENPITPLTSTSLAEWMNGGKSKAGALVSEGRVMGLPAYFRAMAIRAGVEAALPIKVYKKGTRERLQARTVLDRPNPAQSPTAFWWTLYSHRIGWGDGYAHKIRNGADVVTQMRPLHPSRVRVEPVDITGDNPEGKLFIVTDRKGREHLWTAWEVFHLPHMSPDGIRGVSALRSFRDSLGIAIAAEDSAGKFFANGSRLAGILRTKQKLDKPVADRLQQRWQETVGSGSDSSGRIAILDADAEFQTVAISPQDAQLLASRQWAVTEIARMVGVLPHMIGDTERSTSWGTGIEAQFIGWVQTTVGPDLRDVEQVISAELVPGGWDGGYYAEYTIEGLLRGDSAARAGFYKTLREMGVLTIDDILARENMELVGGDVGGSRLLPSNMAIVSPDGTIAPLSAGGGISVDADGKLVVDVGSKGDGQSGARELAEIIQKIYLGVGVVVTEDEARSIINQAGGDLAIPGPALAEMAARMAPAPPAPPVFNVDARTTVEPSVINIPEQPAPNVTVERSDVHIAAPIVRVEPVINMPPPERAATRKTIERNAEGQITAVIEENADE